MHINANSQLKSQNKGNSTTSVIQSHHSFTGASFSHRTRGLRQLPTGSGMFVWDRLQSSVCLRFECGGFSRRRGWYFIKGF
jgi:hypothetical protein